MSTMQDWFEIRDLYERFYWTLNTGEEDPVYAPAGGPYAPGAEIELYNGTIIHPEDSAKKAVVNRDNPILSSRQQHLTNIVVDPGDDDDHRRVRAYFLVTQVTNHPVTEIRHSCYSRDVVQRVDGLWRLKRRQIRLNDQTTTNEWS